MIGAPDSDVVSGSLRSAREHHLDHELLDAAEIHRRFPPFTPRQGIVAFYEKEAGSLFPEEAISAHLAMAANHGAELHFNERVEDWQVSASGTIAVTTSRSRYECGRLILAPGAWAASLFKIDWLPLEVEPQVLYWFDPTGGAVPFAPDRFPIYIWDLGGGVQFYGFPADDQQRVKVAFFRSPNDGRTVDARVARAVPARPRVWADRRFRELQVHADARPPFRDRPSPRLPERGRRVAVFRPRLQIRERDWRNPRRPRNFRRHAASNRSVLAVTIFWFQLDSWRSPNSEGTSPWRHQ